MRVGLLTKEGTTIWLAGQSGTGEREFSSVSGLQVAGQINVQENQFIRAAAATQVDRKNLATTVSFGTTRKFPTATAAELFALDYDNTQPRTGTLILESPQPGGGVSRRYMRGAVVDPPGREVIGVTVLLHYTVRGGLILLLP